MTMKLTSTNKIQTYINCAVYGESGIGKTVLCSTAPAPLILSAEGGLLSLQDKNIPVFEMTRREDIDEIYDMLVLSKEAKKYKTICIDSGSELAEVLLSTELKKSKDPRQAYGTMATEMAITIRGFRDLPFNTYFSFKVKKVVDETTGVITIMPSVPGQMLLNNLPYFFDEVFNYAYSGSGEKKFRALHTEGSARAIAKDRSGRLNTIERPDLTHVFNKILTQTQTQTKEVTKNAITT